MEKLYENIKALRIEKGISQDELARLAGYKDRSSIAKIESGKVDLQQSKIMSFARVLGTTPTALMGLEDQPLPSNALPIKKKRLPLLGNIACGEPIYADEDWQGYVEGDVKADFCLRATGDSMIGARIYDGDIVFIRQQPTVENGEIAAVLIDDEATLKRVSYDQQAGILTLYPENPAHRPLRYEGAELENIRILGKAIVCQFDIN